MSDWGGTCANVPSPFWGDQSKLTFGCSGTAAGEQGGGELRCSDMDVSCGQMGQVSDSQGRWTVKSLLPRDCFDTPCRFPTGMVQCWGEGSESCKLYQPKDYKYTGVDEYTKATGKRRAEGGDKFPIVCEPGCLKYRTDVRLPDGVKPYRWATNGDVIDYTTSPPRVGDTLTQFVPDGKSGWGEFCTAPDSDSWSDPFEDDCAVPSSQMSGGTPLHCTQAGEDLLDDAVVHKCRTKGYLNNGDTELRNLMPADCNAPGCRLAEGIVTCTTENWRSCTVYKPEGYDGVKSGTDEVPAGLCDVDCRVMHDLPSGGEMVVPDNFGDPCSGNMCSYYTMVADACWSMQDPAAEVRICIGGTVCDHTGGVSGWPGSCVDCLDDGDCVGTKVCRYGGSCVDNN